MQQVDTSNSFTMKLTQIADILSAQLVGQDITVTGISTDTRTLQGGELFVALKGPSFDGHDYIQQALDNGAIACLVEKNVNADHFVITENTHDALGELAKAWRQQYDKTVFAITGSNGKTTVKEMIFSILNQEHSAMATYGNLNNDIGVPLTLFRLNDKYDAAVIEMGANHLNEIQYLTNIALPNIAMITNVGTAHLGEFGGIENTAKAKGEIFENMPAGGYAIINADDDYADYWKGISKQHKIITFGFKQQADVTAEIIHSDNKTSATNLLVSTPKGECRVSFNLSGEHNIVNALCAVAACVAADIPLEQIVNGLEAIKPISGRLQMKTGINSSQILDDTYNANPTSLYAALNVLKNMSGKHYLALGDMGELGESAEVLHKESGLYAKETGIDALYSYGQLAALAAKEFGKNGFVYEKHDDMITALKNDLAQDVTLLIKGSRSMHMENVVNALIVEEG